MSGRSMLILIMTIVLGVGGFFYHIISDPGTSMGARFAMDRELRSYQETITGKDKGAILIYLLGHRGSSLKYGTATITTGEGAPVNRKTDANGMTLVRDLAPGIYRIGTPENSNLARVEVRAGSIEKITIVVNQD